MNIDNNKANKYFDHIPEGKQLNELGLDCFKEVLHKAITDPNFNQDEFIDILFNYEPPKKVCASCR